MNRVRTSAALARCLGATIVLWGALGHADVAVPSDSSLDDNRARTPALRPAQARTLKHRDPHGEAEFNVGLLALPNALICVRGEAGCTRGSASLLLSAWPLFRPQANLAFGAGLTMALTPSDSAPGGGTEVGQRDHSRNYFLAETTARYFASVRPTFEAWVGVTSGLVVVSDTFTSSANQPYRMRMGNAGVNVTAEGLTLGLAGGASWALSRSILFGGNLRFANWFLPGTAAGTALGDKASLTGSVAMFSTALSLTYAGR